MRIDAVWNFGLPSLIIVWVACAVLALTFKSPKAKLVSGWMAFFALLAFVLALIAWPLIISSGPLAHPVE